jgi:drug/metabolite transporter (DMT)-like permease
MLAAAEQRMTATPASPVESSVPARGTLAQLWGMAWMLLPLTALFWSGNAVLARAVRDAVPPVTLAFLRWAVASLLVLILAWPQVRRDLPELRRQWRMVVALALLGISAFNTLLYWGLQTTTALNGVLMQSAMPLVIIVFALLLYGDRPRPREIVAVVISMLGVAVIVTEGSLAGLLAMSVDRGDLLVLLAVVLYSLYSALLPHRPQVHPMSLLAATFAVGALFLTPLWLWERGMGARIAATAPAVLAVAYMAIFPSIIAYLFFNRSVALIGAAKAGQVVYLMPVIGSFLAMLFLGERFRLFHAAGAALIGTGIVLAETPLGRRHSPATARIVPGQR